MIFQDRRSRDTVVVFCTGWFAKGETWIHYVPVADYTRLREIRVFHPEVDCAGCVVMHHKCASDCGVTQ